MIKVTLYISSFRLSASYDQRDVLLLHMEVTLILKIAHRLLRTSNIHFN